LEPQILCRKEPAARWFPARYSTLKIELISSSEMRPYRCSPYIYIQHAEWAADWVRGSIMFGGGRIPGQKSLPED
jgi:hypothetical protein